MKVIHVMTAVSLIGIVANVSWLITSGVTWSERDVDDWYAFRSGSSVCGLLNRSYHPFRAMTLDSCSACSPPSGSTGALGSSCSAYEALQRQTSPYANDGIVPIQLQGNPVCDTGESVCCREECDTCRSCTGSGSDRSCTTKKCRCRCVDSRTTKCIVSAAREWEARIAMWVSDIASHPDVTNALPAARGVFRVDLTTPEQFRANPVPFNRRGFASRAAAESASEPQSYLADSAKTAGKQLEKTEPVTNCFVSEAFVPQTSLTVGTPYYAPDELVKNPSTATLRGYPPTTILLSDAALRATYLSSRVEFSTSGPSVPASGMQIVSKGDLRFALELREIPSWYWVMFAVPGLLLAMSLCGVLAIIGRQFSRLDREDSGAEGRLCKPCGVVAESQCTRGLCAVWAVLVVPLAVFLPMFLAMRAAQYDQPVAVGVGAALGAWLLGTVVYIIDICSDRSPFRHCCSRSSSSSSSKPSGGSSLQHFSVTLSSPASSDAATAAATASSPMKESPPSYPAVSTYPADEASKKPPPPDATLVSKQPPPPAAPAAPSSGGGGGISFAL